MKAFWLPALFILACAWSGRANTEIVNFEVGSMDILSSTMLQDLEDWPKLNSVLPSGQWAVVPASANETRADYEHDYLLPDFPRRCNGGLGLVLDLSDPVWTSNHKFTLRASWAGSSPVDVSLRIHSPSQTPVSTQSRHPSSSEHRRAVCACIMLRQSGPPTPFGASALLGPVPFVLELEPLALGILPHSVVPTIVALLVTVAITAGVVSRMSSRGEDGDVRKSP